MFMMSARQFQPPDVELPPLLTGDPLVVPPGDVALTPIRIVTPAPDDCTLIDAFTRGTSGSGV
jgi:hypothetical protein